MESNILHSAFVLLLGLTICHAACVNNATEEANNRVEVKFYRLQVSQWDSGLMESKFHALLADNANTYCEANLDACGLANVSSKFKDANIGKVEGSPTNDEKNMVYSFSIGYPTSAAVLPTSTLQCVLSVAVVKNIVKQLRDSGTYISSLGCERCHITYIDDDFYGIPPASLENKIIIPIAFLVLIIIIIIAVALKTWEKRREKERKSAMNNMPKSKKKSAEPEYVISGEPTKATPPVDDKMKSTKPSPLVEERVFVKKDKMYTGSSTATPKKNMERSGGASNDSGLDVEAYESRKGGRLQPLDPATGDGEEKKKKRKKEKKRSKRSKVDGVQNEGYMAEDEGVERHEMKTDL